MRKTTVTIVALGIVWIGYTAWPLYELLVFVRAIEVRDVETVKRHVYFDAVRRSFSSQLITAYMRRTGNKVSPLAQSMAAAALGIADPVLNKLVSPEALSELLSVGWPVTVVPSPPPDTVGISMSTIGTIWQIFGNSEYGIGRFEVSAPSALPQQQRFGLTFRLLQWRWQLADISLPETIQNLLADELIKTMKVPRKMKISMTTFWQRRSARMATSLNRHRVQGSS